MYIGITLNNGILNVYLPIMIKCVFMGILCFNSYVHMSLTLKSLLYYVLFSSGSAYDKL